MSFFSGLMIILPQRLQCAAPSDDLVEHHRFANSTTSGNSRTSSKNLASKGEPLSLRQTRAKGNRKFKSATGINTTPAGHRQRVALLTNATPSPHETRLRIVASFTPS